jgi:hypothetical protein
MQKIKNAILMVTERVVCYISGSAFYRGGDGKFGEHIIHPEVCTHAIYTFIGLNVDGTVTINDPEIEEIQGI